MKKQTILTYIPDDVIVKELKQYLQELGTVQLVTTIDDLFLAVEMNKPEIILIATHLLGYEAHAVIKEIRSLSFQSKILILLKDYSTQQRLTFFKLGADAFIPYPYHPKECFYRIQNLMTLKRVYPNEKYKIAGQVVYSATNYMLTVADKRINLRRREGEVLNCLAHHRGTVLTREQIARWIWGDATHGMLNTIDVYIKRLRESLHTHGEVIKTIRGKGYMLATVVYD